MKTVVPVLLAAIWISLIEFLRNELVLKSFWIEHYQKLGLVFPSDPVNGAVWGVWSFLFAIAIYIMAQRFSLLQTTSLAWFTGFVLMWIVTGNLGVLPFSLLIYAVPASMVETFIAALLIKKLS